MAFVHRRNPEELAAAWAGVLRCWNDDDELTLTPTTLAERFKFTPAQVSKFLAQKLREGATTRAVARSKVALASQRSTRTQTQGRL